MDFKNRLKGTVTQTLLKALLEDAGYRVVPLGIEGVIREVTALPIQSYAALGLSLTLRKLPDFFVADATLKEHWLVEVKYRKQWDAETRKALGKELSEQVAQWQPVLLVVFLGTPITEGNDTPAASFRVVRLLKDDTGLHTIQEWTDFLSNEAHQRRVEWGQIEWGTFTRFQDEFVDVTARWGDATLIKVASLLPGLKALDLFE